MFSDLEEWPPSNDKKERKIFADTNYDTIILFHPLEAILNTKEFQRLHQLKQLGIGHLVYPSATHTRFAHCLGTYWLAYKLIQEIRKKSLSPTEISGEDHLCVCIAALCHDLGHGPLSHLFDGAFKEKIGKQFKHEEITVLLLRRIFSQEHIRRKFYAYLGAGERFWKNLNFICELIISKRKNSSGNWIAEGRPAEKSFLYDVVSNDNDGIDVDKWDYLIRDSLHCGVGISFNKTSISRLIENARILADPETGLNRICYASKVADTLLQIGHSRQQLHDLLYQHKTLMALENMIVKALSTADQHLTFWGDDGNLYPLSRVMEDMGAFLRTDDSILTQIMNSTAAELGASRALIEAIHRRDIPVRVDEEMYSLHSLTHKYKSSALTVNQAFVQAELKSKMSELIGDTQEEEFILIPRLLHRGFLEEEPMKKVLLYDPKQIGEIKPYRVHSEWLRLKIAPEPEIHAIGVYVQRSSTKRQQIREAFRKAVEQIGLRYPAHE